MVEIQTDKALVEISAPQPGRIVELRVTEGSVTPVGTVIIVIEPSGATPRVAPSVPEPIQSGTGPAAPSGREDAPARRVVAAPAVRRMAHEAGVDLTQVTGSGPAGRVLPSDLRAFLAAPPTSPAPALSPEEHAPVRSEPSQAKAQAPDAVIPVLMGTAARVSRQTGAEPASTVAPLTGLRRRMAQRMTEAWAIPQVTIFDTVEVSALVALRASLQEVAAAETQRFTYLPLLVRALVVALREHPWLNATLQMEQQTVVLHAHVHVGVAVALPPERPGEPGGLVVPVLHAAEMLPLHRLTAELARLTAGARTRSLSPAELSGSTFTITNFGAFGGELGTPILNPPEVAILGVGRIEPRPVVVDGQVAARPTLPLALTFDHRLLDGAAAGAFLTRYTQLLHEPHRLLWEA
jgi:pyruvate/2-oxoglutarate dehydrogenase complex dihydrolipoamide acyltransferase (E2) component